MKNIVFHKLIWFLIISVFTLGVISSCRENDDEVAKAGLPVIEKVTGTSDSDGKPVDLTPIIRAQANTTIIIHGSGFKTLKHIYFNGVESSFNQNFVTDNNITIKISDKTPYANANNKVKLVTEFGELEYDFIIDPPAPEISSYNSINAKAGETITIYGKHFLNPEVTIGGVKATVSSSTLTEVKAVVPANSDDKYVSVTTVSGTSTSEEAMGSALYDDNLQGDAGHWTWSSFNWDLAYKDDKVQGQNSMKIEFPASWTGLDMKFNSRDISKYKAFRVKIKSVVDNKDASLKFVFGGWAYQLIKPITKDWTTLEIPFSEFGNPTTFDQLTLQESGNFGGNTILIDNMGFVLK